MSSVSDLKEDKLIKLAQSGDEAAFDRLLDAHYDRVYRFAYKWCGNAADAEDITQQACIKLARSIAQFRFDSAFSSWLYRLVINCAKDWHKSQRRHESEELVVEPSNRQEGLQEGEGVAYLDQILKFLDQMADGFKETALLVFAEGRNHKEVADILGLKESTVSWRIHEIRKQLRILVQEEAS